MKILLLLMGIYILYQKKSSIKRLFKTKEQMQKEFKQSFNQFLSSMTETLKFDNDEATSLFNLICLLLCLFYILFYILSAIFVNTFLFTLLSVSQIILAFKTITEVPKQSEALNNGIEEEYKNIIIPSKLYTLFNLILDIGYLGLLFYTVYLSY